MKKTITLLLAALLLIGLAPVAGIAASTENTAQSAEALLSNYTPEELLQLWNQIGDMLRADGLYPFIPLEKGDVGPEVTALQTRLAALGYYEKEIVDNFGNGTYNALRDFEKANGLKVDGKASVEDQIALFSGAAVAYSPQNTASTTNNSGGNDAVSGATTNNP